MIKTINKPCPGDCSVCSYPNEIPGFDMYGCAINQSLQRIARIERQILELRDVVSVKETDGKEEKIIIKHKEEANHETSIEELSEQKGQE